MIKDLLQAGDWMRSLDLKDAYLAVLIAKEHRKYLCFLWSGKFSCLPSGLCSAPHVFTKLLRPVMAHLRSQGLQTIIYLDNILVIHQVKTALCQEVDRMCNLLELLGFTINQPKSQTIPVQRIQFLGFLVDLTLMKLLLPQEKIDNIIQMCQSLRKQPQATVHQLSQLLGKITAAAPADLSAPIRYRHLQKLKIRPLTHFKSFNQTVSLNKESMSKLHWWSENLMAWNGREIVQPPPDLVIEMDASLIGWGAVCEGVQTGGLWSQEEQLEHINVLELTAGMFAVQAFENDRRNLHVHLRMDNTSALTYVTKMRVLSPSN